MTAANYWSDDDIASLRNEESLEVQAREIDGEIVRFQARIRGFVCRFPTGQGKANTRSSIHVASSGNRHRTEDLANCFHEAEVQGADQLQNASSDEIPKRSENGASHLQDPDFAEKRIDHLPLGWLSAWTQDGNPFFVELESKTSTWTHPRQEDAHQLFGPNFNLQQVWKQYLAHCSRELSSSEVETPTIGELATYHCAIEVVGESTIMAPWWCESHVSSLTQSACKVCRHINFDALLHTTSAWGDTHTIPLGTLRSIAQKATCAFCRLVVKAVCPNTEDGLRHLADLGHLIRCNLIQSQQWTGYSTTIRPLYIQTKLLWQTDSSPQYVTVEKIQQILQGAESPPEQKHNDSRLVENEIDTKLVKSWLQTCEHKHQQLRMQHNAIYPSFELPKIDSIFAPSILVRQPCNPVALSETLLELTLIDVCLECLVDTDPGVRYIALSYVWGGPQPFQNTKIRGKQLYTPGAISVEDTNIPLTIRDSIRFVAMLEERYLWIDSLCIVQDNSTEKMEQIANMGNIYSRAVMTLVVADGSSCHAGLPGLRPGSRTSRQHKEEVDGMLLATELRDMPETVDASIWNTRGWTYQERELSKRYLYFTNNCVYFSCNQMVCKEDSGLRDVSRASDKAARIRAENHPVWNNYRRAVRKFTKRTLSFEDDVINAFEGIISLLQPAFKCNFLYGLPETELDVALLWQPASKIRRRITGSTGEPTFPSWSWAGWVGEVDYVWTPHLLDDLSRVRWQVQGTDSEEYITSNQLRSSMIGDHGQWEYVRPPDGSREVTPYYYQPEQPEIWCLHPTAGKETRRAHALLRPGTHELKFTALSAVLQIAVKPHTLIHNDYDQLSSCTFHHHIRCPVEIFSADGFVAGTVYIPAHLMESLASGLRELICLSRRRSHHLDPFGTNIYGNYPTYDTYPQPQDDFAETSKHPTLYPNQRRIENAWDRFDHSRYNSNKPWPLYNVMLIERKGDLAYRVALEIVHITAFMQAAPVEKLIVLA